MQKNYLNNCKFCIEHRSDTFAQELKDLTIIESENFRVYPTYGQITNGGYVLIVPKEHHGAIGAMPQEFFDELKEIKDETQKRIKNAYGLNSLFLEHGGIGQTVFHAHIHAAPVPSNIDLFNVYHHDFSEYTQLESLKDLCDIWKTRGQYLFYEVNDHQFAFFTHIKPMYGRFVLAEALGVPERANWRTMDRTLDEQLINETVEKLKEQ